MKSICSPFLYIWLAVANTASASYELDTEFFRPMLPSTVGSGGTDFHQATFAPDGSCLISGRFVVVNGMPGFGRIIIDHRGELIEQPHAINSGADLDWPTIALQGDKLIAVTSHSIANARHASRLSRYSMIGQKDTSFDDLLLETSGSPVRASYLNTLADGRVLVSMGSTEYSERAGMFIGDFLLEPDGRRVPGRDLSGMLDGSIRAGLLLPSGKLLIGGSFRSFGGKSVSPLIRLNADLSLDSSFVSDLVEIPNALAIRSSGEIVVGTDTGIRYLNSSGRQQPGHSRTIAPVRALHVEGPRTRCVVGNDDFWALGSKEEDFPFYWQILNAGQPAMPHLTVLSEDEQRLLVLAVPGPLILTAVERRAVLFDRAGQLDPDFKLGFRPIEPIALVRSGNSVFYAGSFRSENGSPGSGILKFDWSGKVDPTFNTGQLNVSGGRILVTGKDLVTSVLNTRGERRLIRLREDGSADPTFHPADNLHVVLEQPDGNLLVIKDHELSRLLPDGAFDPNFRCCDFETSESLVALQSDGKLLVGTPVSWGAKLLRLNPDGSQDETFVPPMLTNLPINIGYLHALPNGTILLSGMLRSGSYSSSIVALRPNGEIDREFPKLHFGFAGYLGTRLIFPMVVGAGTSGDVYLAGIFDHANGQVFSGLVRLIERPKIRSTIPSHFRFQFEQSRPRWSIERWEPQWSVDLMTWHAGGFGFDGQQWIDEHRMTEARFYRLRRAAP